MKTNSVKRFQLHDELCKNRVTAVNIDTDTYLWQFGVVCSIKNRQIVMETQPSTVYSPILKLCENNSVSDVKLPVDTLINDYIAVA